MRFKWLNFAVVSFMAAWIVLSSVAAQTLRLPFKETFVGEKLDASWTMNVSKGNTIRPTTDGIEITAAENTFAHVERTLGVDPVRTTCEIKPGSGISWATSLFLYWAPGDWCQLGIIPRGGGCYYVCLMEEGLPEEHDLNTCEFNRWHYLAIELGKDIIRFESSLDGNTWKMELVVTRSQRFSGAPKLVILGKGYGRSDNEPDLDSDYDTRGPVSESRIRNLTITLTNPGRLTRTDEDRRIIESSGSDKRGVEVLAAPGDPSFDAVARYLPPLQHPREVVGVKDHGFEIGVGYDGTIQLATGDGDWGQHGSSAFFEINSIHFGRGNCKKHLLNGYLPVVISTWTQDELECEETVFGWSAGMKDNAPLWGCVRLKVTAKTERAIEVVLRVMPESLQFPTQHRSFIIPNGGTASVCFEIPSPLGDRHVAELSPTEFEARLREAGGSWTDLLNNGLKISVPETRVNDAWRAWLAYNFLNVDRKRDLYEIHDGSGFYEEIYGYSAALFCNALDLFGHHADARRYLESMLSLLKPEGLFFVNYGYPDQGALLFALVQHYQLTGDRDWLKTVALKMVRMCDWIIEKRKSSVKKNEGHPVTRGLVKFTPYADYQEQTFDYYGDSYGCIGMEYTARVLAEIGMKTESERIAKEAASYRVDIFTSMDTAVIERDGFKILPMEPETHRLLKSTGYKAGGYYGLIASMLLESGFLSPIDQRTKWVTDFMEKKGGLILGMCEFMRGIDHAYTYGYWLTSLYRDDIKRVLLGFYGSLAYGMGRDTYCGVEVTQILTGDGTATTPHTYSGTQQLRLLRMMLLHEKGDTLLIGQGIPRQWLAPGENVEVRDAPTSFGPVSFRIESKQKSVTVHIIPPTRSLPQAVRLCLRHPGLQPIKHVEVIGGQVYSFSGETIELHSGLVPMQVEVIY